MEVDVDVLLDPDELSRELEAAHAPGGVDDYDVGE